VIDLALALVDDGVNPERAEQPQNDWHENGEPDERGDKRDGEVDHIIGPPE
jgi:hypothetical protein